MLSARLLEQHLASGAVERQRFEQPRLPARSLRRSGSLFRLLSVRARRARRDAPHAGSRASPTAVLGEDAEHFILGIPVGSRDGGTGGIEHPAIRERVAALDLTPASGARVDLIKRSAEPEFLRPPLRREPRRVGRIGTRSSRRSPSSTVFGLPGSARRAASAPVTNPRAPSLMSSMRLFPPSTSAAKVRKIS